MTAARVIPGSGVAVSLSMCLARSTSTVAKFSCEVKQSFTVRLLSDILMVKCRDGNHCQNQNCRICYRLSEFRNSKGITRAALAKQIGINQFSRTSGAAASSSIYSRIQFLPGI